MTEHPELRKGRRRWFIPIKDNNAGKEFSAATISRWICTTKVDSHAALQYSKSIPDRSNSTATGAIVKNLASNVNLSHYMDLWTLGGKLQKNYCWTFSNNL